MAARWSSERPDRDWTENLTGYIASTLGAADAGVSTLTTADCRQSLCRVSLRSDGSGTLLRLAQLASTDQVTFRHQVEGDGGVRRMVVFIPRGPLEGNEKPKEPF